MGNRPMLIQGEMSDQEAKIKRYKKGSAGFLVFIRYPA